VWQSGFMSRVGAMIGVGVARRRPAGEERR
jgi:hypothetical protein